MQHFQAKNHYDQLCYETDLQELKDNNTENLMKQLEIGLTLILDYNEERQIDLEDSSMKKSRVQTLEYNDDRDDASFYLNTISKV